MTLYFEPRLSAVDGLYERLIALHAGLSDEESHRVNARLILLLANQIGDTATVMEALAVAEKPNSTERERA